MYKKKIVLVCATLAITGLLMTGCSKKCDTELRREVYKTLRKVPKGIHSIEQGYNIITVKNDDYEDLKVTIKNNITGDTLEMIDYGIAISFLPVRHGQYNGVEKVKYNDYEGSTDGMDEVFDQALRYAKPSLENRVQKEIDKVKENTKLK